jgi:hypothetical protein
MLRGGALVAAVEGENRMRRERLLPGVEATPNRRTRTHIKKGKYSEGADDRR